MATFLSPKWNATENHYVIETTKEFQSNLDDHQNIVKDTLGSTAFEDMDAVHNTTDDMVATLIEEGAKNKWFSKLPSQEQLMKRVRHTFARLAADTDTRAFLTAILMTPKMLTFVWMPTKASSPLYVEDSDSDEGIVDPQLKESALPPVALRDTAQQSHEEYLLTRLRAARARMETEEVRLEYFETTGRMPPESDSEAD